LVDSTRVVTTAQFGCVVLGVHDDWDVSTEFVSQPLVWGGVVSFGRWAEATVAPDDESVVRRHTSEKIRAEFFDHTLFFLVCFELPPTRALDPH
jgi:hypothetical protein